MKIGFIGCGNMAGAIISGLLKSGIVDASGIKASDLSEEAVKRAGTELGIRADQDNTDTVKFADILVLAVKPQFLADAISNIKDFVKKDQIIISLAPGKTLEWLKNAFEAELKLVRTMPNTPALAGEGMTALCPNELVTKEDLTLVEQIFGSVGKCSVLPEKLMDCVTGVSGSSPAFIFILIEAMADAAVAEGMPRSMALEFAAQSVLGSAKMVLESGKHPGELKDMVCSPGGTTIEGVHVLEESGFRGIVMDAVRAAVERSKEL